MSDDNEMLPELWIVPWISTRARPRGVCRREGSGFVGVVVEAGDGSGGG